MSNKTILGVMGDAGSGKSVFSSVAQLHGWNRQQMGVGLKLIESFAYNFYTENSDKEPDSYPYLISGNYHQLTDSWMDIEQYYKDILSFGDYCAILITAFEWFKYNKIVIHNGIRRNSLIYIGTEIMRKEYGHDVHIKGIVNWLSQQEGDRWVIESVRFVNEIESLSAFAQEFIPVVISRPNREKLDGALSSHSSENDWKKWTMKNPDKLVKIENDGTIGEYISKVNSFFEVFDAH